jgi:N-hydroxyarylamine O-acetyltransferase
MVTIQPSPSDAPAASEWGIDRVDLDAYRRRTGFDGPLVPTTETLFALHRTHAEHIPFENLDIPLGHGISLDLDDIQGKLLRQHRGGYCFEHNLLFAAVLERVGFTVRRLVARVQPDKPGPRTHMTLNVRVGDQAWLADVGFGAALLEPMPLVDDAIARQGDWTNGVARRPDGTWRLRSLGADGWADLYSFTQEPQRPNDYEVYNHYVSTHPASPFVGQIVAIRITPQARYTLRGRLLTTAWANGQSEQRELRTSDVIGVLDDTFGITLATDDAARLLAIAGQSPAAR